MGLDRFSAAGDVWWPGEPDDRGPSGAEDREFHAKVLFHRSRVPKKGVFDVRTPKRARRFVAAPARFAIPGRGGQCSLLLEDVGPVSACPPLPIWSAGGEDPANQDGE